MPSWLAIDWLLPLACIVVVLAFFGFWRAFRQLRRLRLLSGGLQLSWSLLIFALGLNLGGLYLATQSYRQLSAEQQVATLVLTRNGTDRFVARLILDEQRVIETPLYGDQVQVSAYIVKWKPWLTTLGFKPLYRLDRISGRFSQVENALASQFSAQPINSDSAADIAEWRQRYQALSFAVDVEQGSAAYVAVGDADAYAVLVSDHAVILRPLAKQ